VVDLLPYRAHHQHGQAQRNADQDLVGRALLQAQGLAQDSQDNDEAGKAGHHHQHGRQKPQQRHHHQDLQLDAQLLAIFTVSKVQQRDFAIGRPGALRHQDHEQHQKGKADRFDQPHSARSLRLEPLSSTMRKP